MDVFKILAAILHLGNVQITALGSERSTLSVRDLFVSPFLCLEGPQEVPLLLHFSIRQIGPTGETSLTGTRKQEFPWVTF